MTIKKFNHRTPDVFIEGTLPALYFICIPARWDENDEFVPEHPLTFENGKGKRRIEVECRCLAKHLAEQHRGIVKMVHPMARPR